MALTKCEQSASRPFSMSCALVRRHRARVMLMVALWKKQSSLLKSKSWGSTCSTRMAPTCTTLIKYKDNK